MRPASPMFTVLPPLPFHPPPLSYQCTPLLPLLPLCSPPLHTASPPTSGPVCHPYPGAGESAGWHQGGGGGPAPAAGQGGAHGFRGVRADSVWPCNVHKPSWVAPEWLLPLSPPPLRVHPHHPQTLLPKNPALRSMCLEEHIKSSKPPHTLACRCAPSWRRGTHRWPRCRATHQIPTYHTPL